MHTHTHTHAHTNTYTNSSILRTILAFNHFSEYKEGEGKKSVRRTQRMKEDEKNEDLNLQKTKHFFICEDFFSYIAIVMPIVC